MAMRKKSEQIQARAMRSSGLSVKEIAKKLQVSISSVSVWVRQVPLTSKAQRTLQNNAILGLQRARTIAAQKATERRIERDNDAKLEADTEWGLLRTDPNFMFGLALYIGEGSKDRHMIDVTNSNPAVLKGALRFFTKLGVPLCQVHVVVVLHENDDRGKALQYWATELGIPQEQFYPPTIARASDGNCRKKLPYGTAKVRTYNVWLKTKITRWMELALSE